MQSNTNKAALHGSNDTGQFHRRGCHIQTQFSNFNLAQTEYKKELSSFPLFINMFLPADTLTGLPIDSFLLEI